MTEEDLKNVEILHKVHDWGGFTMNQKLRETHWETVQLNERSLLANCYCPSHRDVGWIFDTFCLSLTLLNMICFCCLKSNVRWRNSLCNRNGRKEIKIFKAISFKKKKMKKKSWSFLFSAAPQCLVDPSRFSRKFNVSTCIQRFILSSRYSACGDFNATQIVRFWAKAVAVNCPPYDEIVIDINTKTQ